MRTLRLTLATTCGIALAAGCSLINSYDDVKPEVEANGGSANGGGGNTGSGGRGDGGNDASAGGTTDGGSANGGGGATGGSGNGGDTSDGGGSTSTGGAVIKDSGADVYVPGGDDGVIVAYNAGNLVVVSPKDGTVLSTEKMGTVRGIANDAATDLWYIFAQSTASAADAVALHVRELRTQDGKWREIATVKSVPVPFVSRPQALNGRLAYLSTSTPVSPDPATVGLTVLNTADSSKITPLAGTPASLPPGVKQGLLGAPSTTAGGLVTVVYLSDPYTDTDNKSVADVQLAKYFVSTSVIASTNPAPKTLGKVLGNGNISFTSDPIGQSVILGLPVLTEGTTTDCTQVTPENASVLKISMNTLATSTTKLIPVASHRFGGAAAYDPCLDTSYLTTSIADLSVFAVPMSDEPTDKVSKTCRQDAGATLLIEPYTRTLIRSLSGGRPPEFYTLSGTATEPKLTSKSLQKLPLTFAPSTFSVREIDRSTISCPK